MERKAEKITVYEITVYEGEAMQYVRYQRESEGFV